MPLSQRILLNFIVSFGLCSTSYAGTFAVADSRTQALAGTSVALGNAEQGFLYNPALIALHKGDEDETQDGVYSFVVLLDGLSDGAQTAATAITDDLEGELTLAIDNLNAATNVNSARQAIQAANDLGKAMRELNKQSIYADLYTGFSISEPGDAEGGAFFIGTRLMAVGESTIEQADLDLLDDYVEALTFIESFGTEGQQHPELLDADGQFINPSDQILSSAEGSAFLVTEAGLAFGKQVEWWGQSFSFGASPKIVQLRSYDERWGVEEGDFNNQSAEQTQLFLNVDFGMVWLYGDHFRAGLSLKDALAKQWQTNLGREFELTPKTRFGVAYWGEKVRVGFDVDLNKGNHLQSDLPVQQVAVGLEWQMFSGFALRGGYRQDLEETLGSSTTAGLAFRWRRFATELSVSAGDFDSGAALQFSFYH